MVLDGKSSQEYLVNAGVQGSILGLTLFLLYSDLPDDVTCKIVTFAEDVKLHSKCNQASDLWQQELVSEVGSDLQDTVA